MFPLDQNMAQRYNHSHHHNHNSTKNIRAAFFLNLLFTIVEIAGGILTNSIAILSDALHDLGDSLSLGLSWYFQKISQKERDKNFTFGYKRFSIFGAVINSAVLIIGSVFILLETIPRLIDPIMPNTEGMIYLAVLGILFNGAAILKLKKGTSLNEKVVTLHLMEDVFGWVAVLAASIIMTYLYLPILDPILSLLIAAWILIKAFKNIKSALMIILQGTPKTSNVSEIERKITKIQGISSVHDTHLWSMDGEYNVLTVHVVLENNANLNTLSALKQNIRTCLSTEHIEHITIEFEGINEECLHIDC